MRSSPHPTFRSPLGWKLGIAIVLAILGPARAFGDSILLHWTAPGDDGNVGRAAAYELRYSNAPPAGTDTTSWWGAASIAPSLPAPLPAGSRESFAVSGLAPATTYYFVIRTWDDASHISGFSNIAVRQTPTGGGTLATPSGFGAQAVPGGVALFWDEVATNGGDGYRLYRRDGTATTAQLVQTAPLSQTSWTDTTVTGGSQYEYSLVTYDTSGESAPSVTTITLPNDLLASSETKIHGFPNPARDRVTLRFRGGTANGTPGHVRLVVYDLTGHKICVLLDEVVPAGERAIDWDCRAVGGKAVAPGVYTAILDSPEGRQVTRLAIVP